MDMLDALAQSFDQAGKVVAGVGSDQLDGPTPCRDWDVRTLLAHTMGVLANIGRGANGEELLGDPKSFRLDADLGRQFRSEADRTLSAWRKRGLDGQVDIGAGPMPAQAAIAVNLVDTSTHSWDIARATGQDGTLPDELAATVLAAARTIVDDQLRVQVGFDPPVVLPATACPMDQLVAFLGRQP